MFLAASVSGDWWFTINKGPQMDYALYCNYWSFIRHVACPWFTCCISIVFLVMVYWDSVKKEKVWTQSMMMNIMNWNDRMATFHLWWGIRSGFGSYRTDLIPVCWRDNRDPAPGVSRPFCAFSPPICSPGEEEPEQAARLSGALTTNKRLFACHYQTVQWAGSTHKSYRKWVNKERDRQREKKKV